MSHLFQPKSKGTTFCLHSGQSTFSKLSQAWYLPKPKLVQTISTFFPAAQALLKHRDVKNMPLQTVLQRGALLQKLARFKPLHFSTSVNLIFGAAPPRILRIRFRVDSFPIL